MSTMQRVSLIGMYSYDNNLFDNVNLPDGYNKETFIETLLLEHGEKCVLYADVPFMKYSLGIISRKWYHEFERILQTLSDNYNPLYNFDRNEEYTDTENKQNTGSTTGWVGGGSTRTNSPDYTTEQVTDGTTTETVSAFNSNTYEPSKQIKNNDGKTKVSGKSEDISETFGQNSNGTSSDTEWRTLGHNAHLFGNIGVTTSQQMARDEIKLREDLNLYNIVAGIFANELLINIF